jgi:hypothetical protein
MHRPMLASNPQSSLGPEERSIFMAKKSRFALAFVGLAAVALFPLSLMRYPDLEDYLHHLSRAHIISQGARGALSQFYTIDWRLLPNLAMDLVVPPLAALMSIQDAGRLFVGVTLLLVASGTIALHAALHRRLSWWPFLVFLVLWNRDFLGGFFNYLFTLGLGLWALAAWVYWRDRAPWFRVAVFAAIAFMLFIGHLYAFGIYALGVLGYELARTDWSAKNKSGLLGSWLTTGSQFLLPAALFLLHSPTSGYAELFEFPPDLIRAKLRGFHHLFLNYNLWFDRLTFVVLAGAFLLGLATRRILLHPHVRWMLVLLLIAYLSMPQIFFDTGAADYRLPVGFTFVLLAGTELRPQALAHPKLVAAALLALFLVRIGLLAERWVGFDGVYRSFEQVIRDLPEGSTMVTVATRMPDYHQEFHKPHLMYLSALAIIEKSFFDPSFATFADPGKQPVLIKPEYRHVVDQLDVRLKPLPDTRPWSRTPPLDLLLPPGDDGRPLLQNFDYALILYAGDAPNPAPAQLETVFLGPRFQLYKVRHAADARTPVAGVTRGPPPDRAAPDRAAAD